MGGQESAAPRPRWGVIQDGEPVYSQESDLFGIPLRTRLPYLRSIALGGGSVVSVAGDEIKLGPESMGSFPGPVCYGQGGEKPTLTDAFVSAGLVNKVGGRIKLYGQAKKALSLGRVGLGIVEFENPCPIAIARH